MKYAVIDLDLAHTFECDTYQVAVCFEKAIEMVGHIARIIVVPNGRIA